MNYKRFLIFAWSFAENKEGIPNDNPLDKIQASFDTQEEADKEILDLLHFDFISVFDCQERKTVSEIDNLPF